jgi:hypothetical protein
LARGEKRKFEFKTPKAGENQASRPALIRNHAVEKKLNRRLTPMDADEERRQGPKNQGPNGCAALVGLDQLFRPAFICVYLRLSAVEMHRSG